MDTLKESSFGALLRRFRLAAGLSQEELAERAGMSARGSVTSSGGFIVSPTATR